MKRPNGSGTAYKLSGKRRNPWIACFTERTAEGKRKRNIIGYYPTRKDALRALADYQHEPWATSKATLADIYEKWSEQKYSQISESNACNYKAAFRHISPIANRPIIELKHSDLQTLIDGMTTGFESRSKVKSLLRGLYEFAVVNELIGRDKNTVEYLNVGKAAKSDKHYRFTDAEIAQIAAKADENPKCALVLILIYAGCRPGELLSLKKSDVCLKERYFSITQGKNKQSIRRVPIAAKVLAHWETWLSTSGEYLADDNGKPYICQGDKSSFVRRIWIPALTDADCLNYTAEDGTEREHLPHDCRHTFATMWAEKELNEMYRRRIQGHAGQGTGEQVYTHLEIKRLIDEIDKL